VGGAINDLITGVTDLSLAGILNVSGSGDWLGVEQGASWRLFDYTGTLSGAGLTLGTMPTLTGGLSFEIDTTTANQVNLVVVPEPGTLGIAVLGVVVLAYRGRRLIRGRTRG